MFVEAIINRNTLNEAEPGADFFLAQPADSWLFQS